MPADVSEVLALSADLGKAGVGAVLKAQKVIHKVAFMVEGTAKQKAPVDTGALRNSIGSTFGGLSAEIGPTVNYAPYQEFGTARMAPQPFMGPALDAHGAAFTAAMAQIAAEVLGG